MTARIATRIVFGVSLIAATPVWADLQQEIIAALQDEGYTDIDISTTWLRRTRIIGRGSPGQREIVVDPRNDEILRDYTRPAPGGSLGAWQPPTRAARPTGGGNPVMPGSIDGDRPRPPSPGNESGAKRGPGRGNGAPGPGF